MTTKSTRVEFAGAHGDMLAARLERPPSVRAWAVFAHCFTCSKDVFAASRISRTLAGLGIGTLRFDFTGLGNSAGDFANTNFSSNVGDLVAAAEYLRESHGAPHLLVGHSLGGAAVLAAARRIEEVRAVATIGAPCRPSHVTHLLEGSVDEIEATGEADVRIGQRTFSIQRQFLEDINEQRLLETLPQLRRALLVLHAPRDEVVGIENARCIFEAAKHPKSFISLDGADHLLSDHADATYAATVLGHWASRYIDIELVDGRRPHVTAPAESTVRVRSTGTGAYTQDVAVGSRFQLVADEPESFGGDDAGPSPYEYLLVALGACTSMTLHMYARRKDWPLERVTIDLSHEKIHAEDCANCEATTGKVDRMERRILLEGDLDAEQRGRLLEIADRCPVHRTLESEVEIVTHGDDPPDGG